MAPILATFQTFGPQTLTDYEIGTHLKARFGDWITRFNVDAFTGKYNDLQLTANGITAGSLPGVTSANVPSNSTLTLNAGSATVEGVELDGLVSPFRGLDFSFAGAYLNPRYDSLTVPSFLSPFFSSGPFTGAPRWSYSADLRYKLPVPSDLGDFFVDFNHYYIAKQYQGFVLLPAYDLDNLSVQWANVFQQPIDLTFYMNNVFDTTYIHNVSLSTPSIGVYSGSYGPPRMFGVRLRYTFGH
jgi:iron complex outermembrane receptor protein